MRSDAEAQVMKKLVVRITPRSTAGGFSKARGSAPLLLNLKAISRDGYPGHRA
jgi:hypothetical protein